MQLRLPGTVLALYVWDVAGSPQQILDKAKASAATTGLLRLRAAADDSRNQFDLDIRSEGIVFIRLRTWAWLEAKRYKRFTLVAQSLGALITGWEAMQQLVPDIFLETVGFAFLYPLARLFGTRVVSYVHYPTISSDMLGKVRRRESDFNNAGAVAKSGALSALKLTYYRLFSRMYGFAGSFCDVVMVNSSWTQGHINDIWRIPDRTGLVFPPCDTARLIQLPLAGRRRTIISVAQFRPEKNHALQIEALRILLRDNPEMETGDNRVELVLVGSVRNADDALRVEKLHKLIAKFSLQDNVRIIENASYDYLQSLLGSASVGIHTMRDEHFGISIIEYMAAGAIPVAHNSGGPKLDIVRPYRGAQTGFLATTAREYADQLHTALTLPVGERHAMQQAARDAVVARFSVNAFSTEFVAAIKSQIPSGAGGARQ
ncbi:asparagine-linked glycosylation protein [Polyrhizophydium stewartii]|uniref:GDP-Man:Man(3)GlcNAc(2)-PP-Dol alpha-1,2-mannosyltransferase n=1 Tax=Polyrhizophydium stewartii TaxID=2732419 RepID=A0ABR4MYM9_9FUNG